MKIDTRFDFQVRTVSNEAWSFAGTHSIHLGNEVGLSLCIQHNVVISLSCHFSCNDTWRNTKQPSVPTISLARCYGPIRWVLWLWMQIYALVRPNWLSMPYKHRSFCYLIGIRRCGSLMKLPMKPKSVSCTFFFYLWSTHTHHAFITCNSWWPTQGCSAYNDLLSRGIVAKGFPRPWVYLGTRYFFVQLEFPP